MPGIMREMRGAAPEAAIDLSFGKGSRFLSRSEDSTRERKLSEPARLIMLQFLAWVADRPRSYPETMEAWRSTCPRLSVWEDAITDGLVRIDNQAGRAVTLTARARPILE